MSEPPDLETLSRRFLDLWQDQMTAMANDPALAEVMTRLVGMAPPGMAASIPPAIGGASGGAKEGADPTSEAQREGDTPAVSGRRKSKPPSRAAAASASSGGGGIDLDELARRLADVESRLDRLEAGAGAGGGRAQGKPRRRRS
ncbi:MAG: hypothetical protein V3U18_05710 [Alphaproteobacteria bacterium]